MRRREVMIGLGIAVALPAIVRAQQTLPAIGFLSTRSPDEDAVHTDAFRSGLQETGYVEGSSIAIEYRWARGDYGKLPSFAAELLGRPLALLVAAGDPAALAAKAATPSIPVVFLVGGDPVQEGLVPSMNRPGTTTGINFFTGDLGGKRLELLCAMAPSARVVGLLVNPRFSAETDERQRQAQVVAAAAKELGRELVVQEATTDGGIEAAFAAFATAGVTGLIVQNDPFFDSRRSHIVALSATNRLPGIFHIREYPADGGLMSYGASLSDTYRQLGVYAGKVLRGTKPDDLPVLRPTRFELVINAKTARTLGLTVTQSMQIAADELIE
jgi:putative tryptophan/tyrosine transport system substrate-binding protein